VNQWFDIIIIITKDWTEQGLTSHQTYLGHIGDSIKAMKEDRVLWIRLQSRQVYPTELTIIQQLCSMKQKHKIHTDKHK